MSKLTPTPDPTIARKGGRRPLGNVSMTPAERMRRYRAKKGQAEMTGVLVYLNKPLLAFVDALAASQGETRSAVLELLLEQQLWRMKILTDDIQSMLDRGASDDEVLEAHRRRMSIFGPGAQPTPDQLADYRKWKGEPTNR